MAVLAATATMMIAAEPAPAHDGDGGARLARVQIAGLTLFTHGPDEGVRPWTTPWRKAGSPASRFGPKSGENAPLCAADHRFEVVYAHAAGSPSRALRAGPQMRSIVGRANRVLSEDARASGAAGADLRFRCNVNGRVHIRSLRVSEILWETIIAEGRAQGMTARDTKYLVFADDRLAFCGLASMVYDGWPGRSNANNGEAWAVMDPSCWDPESVLHELGHTMGAVQPDAPLSDGDGHCVESFDILCGAGGRRWRSCPELVTFDCGFDTYFDAAPEPGEHLATHWNLGSPANLFITVQR